MIIVHPAHEFAQLDDPLDAKVLLRHPLIMTGRYQPESLSTHAHIELVRAGLGTTDTGQPPPAPHDLSPPADSGRY